MKKLISKVISLFLTVTVCATTFLLGTVPASAENSEFLISDLVSAKKIKTQGRTELKDGLLLVDYSASGIEFNANCSGDITITLNAKRLLNYSTADKGGIYFSVFVDGVMQYANLRYPEDNNASRWTSNSTGYPFHITSTGEQSFTIATGLEAGVHKIEIYNQTQAKFASFGIKSITLSGEILAAPSNNDLYIEVIGDSIAAGEGNIANGGSADENALYMDATRGWPLLTAKQLGADFSVLAQAGIAAMNGVNWAGMGAPVQDWPSINDIYPLKRFYSDKSTVYDFVRQPDVILVALGTNDIWLYQNENKGYNYTLDDVKNGFKTLLTNLRVKNPNADIIWLCGMITSNADEPVKQAVSEMGGPERGYYYLTLPQDKTGGSSHPGLSAQTTYTTRITEYVQSVLADNPLDPEEGNTNIWDGSRPTEMPEFAGEGTAESPYMIENGAQLYWTVSNENAGVHFKLANDIVLNDFTVKMNIVNGVKTPEITDANGNIITNENGVIVGESSFNQWIYNAGSAKTFSGIIDGDNHIIRGLFYNAIKNTQSNQNNSAGLIPNAANVEVYNLGIEDSYLYIHNDIDTTTKQGFATAALIGRLNDKNNTPKIMNSYIGESVYIYSNVVAGFMGTGQATNGVTLENLYSLATLVNVPGSSASRLGAIAGDCWNLATNKPPSFPANTATNVYANAKLFGNRAPFCYNVYGTVAGGRGPQVWNPETNANTSEYLTDVVAITITESKMSGYVAAENMNLGDAFAILPSGYPVLKSFVNRSETEWDGSPDTELNGEGNANSPYLITNAGELAYIIYSGGVENAYYKLTRDITLNNTLKINLLTGEAYNYDPVPWFTSSAIKEFKGAEFNGGGHVVYGIYSNFDGTYAFDNEKGATALFPITRKDTQGTVTIKNIGVASSFIRNYSTGSAIVGYAGNSPYPTLILNNCFVEEDVTVIGHSAGGVLGSGSINISIENCFSLALLVPNGGKAALAGNWWGKTGVKELHIKNSFSTGKIAGNQVTSAENCFENFTAKGATALDAFEGLNKSVWYAVNDNTKYPMLRSRGTAMCDVDENGKFEPANELVAMRKLLLSDSDQFHNADTNDDGNLSVKDLVALKKICAQY